MELPEITRGKMELMVMANEIKKGKTLSDFILEATERFEWLGAPEIRELFHKIWNLPEKTPKTQLEKSLPLYQSLAEKICSRVKINFYSSIKKLKKRMKVEPSLKEYHDIYFAGEKKRETSSNEESSFGYVTKPSCDDCPYTVYLNISKVETPRQLLFVMLEFVFIVFLYEKVEDYVRAVKDFFFYDVFHIGWDFDPPTFYDFALIMRISGFTFREMVRWMLELQMENGLLKQVRKDLYTITFYGLH